MTVVTLWTVMPLLIISAGAVTLLLLGAVIPGRYGTLIGLTTAAGAALWALQPSGPMPPVMGLAFTPFARFMIVFFCICTVAALLLSHDAAKRLGIRGEEYPATILFGLFGMAVLACAVNLLTLFLGLEAMTFAFYILVASDLHRNSSSEAGLKYLLMGAVAAAFLAFGTALVYCSTGTLDIAAAFVARPQADPLLMTAGWCFLLLGIAFKMSLVPAHHWTPDVYQGGPTPVVALLSTASKAASGAALVILLHHAAIWPEPLQQILRLLALLSMTLGNLAALRQENPKRLLAYSSVGQMGYIALAFLAAEGGGLEAAIFYLVVYSLMNLAAFGALTVLEQEGERQVLADFRGLGHRSPLAAGVLALALFSLAGIPPTGGFVGKVFIFFAALRVGEAPAAIVGILAAAISLYFYLRVVVALYLHPAPAGDDSRPQPTPGEKVALVAVTCGILLLGIFPMPLLRAIDTILR